MIDSTNMGRPRPSMKPVLFAVLASFLLGAGIVGLLAWQGYLGVSMAGNTSRADPPAALAGPPTTPTPMPSARQTAAVAAMERVEQQHGGIDQRLAAAEQRLARLDLQAQAASGNAARAEGLLIAFATRRAIERGAELGYLGDQLRLRFADAQPNSVQTVIDFARKPVTLDVLLARLEGLAPQLSAADSQPTFARLRSEMSRLFVIRRETTPSPQPSRRLERARMFLETGRVDKAIAEVEKMPGAANASAWLAEARRYERAQRALDLIETSAVGEPRRLRDGEGRSVDQPGLVGYADPA